MLRLTPPVAGLVLIIAGCQTPTANNPVRYTRMDGRLVSQHPELAAQSQQDIAICRGEGAKAMMTAGPVVYNLSLANNLTADQIAHNRRTNVDIVIEGCMASRGYRKDPGQD